MRSLFRFLPILLPLAMKFVRSRRGGRSSGDQTRRSPR